MTGKYLQSTNTHTHLYIKNCIASPYTFASSIRYESQSPNCPSLPRPLQLPEETTPLQTSDRVHRSRFHRSRRLYGQQVVHHSEECTALHCTAQCVDRWLRCTGFSRLFQCKGRYTRPQCICRCSFSARRKDPVRAVLSGVRSPHLYEASGCHPRIFRCGHVISCIVISCIVIRVGVGG